MVTHKPDASGKPCAVYVAGIKCGLPSLAGLLPKEYRDSCVHLSYACVAHVVVLLERGYRIAPGFDGHQPQIRKEPEPVILEEEDRDEEEVLAEVRDEINRGRRAVRLDRIRHSKLKVVR